jgi:capsular polysaccharide biosynthesis protein
VRGVARRADRIVNVTRPKALLAIIFSAVIVAAVAYAIDQARVPSHNASAVLVVPPGSSTSISDNPQGTSQLAATYRDLLPNDRGAIRAVAAASRMSEDAVRRRFRVTRSSDEGAVLQVTLSARTNGAATRGMSALVRYLHQINASPSSSLLRPRSLRLISSPSSMPPGPTGLARRRASFLVLATSNAQGADAQAANRLAANYAGLIAEDEEVLRYVAARTGLTLSQVSDRLRATNDVNTSIIRVTVRDKLYDRARRAALAVARAMAGEAPIARRVVPGTLQVARLPAARRPSTQKRSTAVGIAGAILGLLFGIGAVLTYNARHPRLRSPDRARELLGVPAVDADDLNERVAASLVRRWREEGATQVALLPLAASIDDVAVRVAHRLRAAALSAEGPAISIVVRPHADALEPRLERHERILDVLVVERGVSFEQARDAIVRYETRGGSIRRVILARRNAAVDVEPESAVDERERVTA